MAQAQQKRQDNKRARKVLPATSGSTFLIFRSHADSSWFLKSPFGSVISDCTFFSPKCTNMRFPFLFVSDLIWKWIYLWFLFLWQDQSRAHFSQWELVLSGNLCATSPASPKPAPSPVQVCVWRRVHKIKGPSSFEDEVTSSLSDNYYQRNRRRIKMQIL